MIFQETKMLEEIDGLIYEDSEHLYLSEEEIRLLQGKHIINAFKYHYERCDLYNRYCNYFNITPEDIISYTDLEKIPLITSSAFKEHKLLSCEENLIVKRCTSSGTMGNMSSVYRDNTTLNRFQGSIRLGLEKVVNLYNAFSVNLSSSAEEAEDLWMAFTVGNLDLLFPTINTIVNGVYNPMKVIDAIKNNINKYDSIMIVGAPVLFIELVRYMQREDIVIEDSENIIFITAGGWKRFSGQAIDRASFNLMIENQFKNVNPKNVRDMFNMVELNTLIPECEYQVKHCSPWVKIMIIDPVTMKSVPDGQEGLIAYLDPTSTSYPCFVLTDDIGVIKTYSKCRCGRTGTTLRFIRRVSTYESRGCALKLDRKYGLY